MIRLMAACLLFLAPVVAHGQLTPRQEALQAAMAEFLESPQPIDCLADADSNSRICYELFNRCEPLRVAVYMSDGDLIGLSEDSVRRIVEDRLKVNGLIYDPESAGPILSITISISELLPEFFPDEPLRYSYSVRFSKSLFDPISGETSGATVWQRGASGEDPERESLLQMMFNIQRLEFGDRPVGPLEEFIKDYLRVNESACD